MYVGWTEVLYIQDIIIRLRGSSEIKDSSDIRFLLFHPKVRHLSWAFTILPIAVVRHACGRGEAIKSTSHGRPNSPFGSFIEDFISSTIVSMATLSNTLPASGNATAIIVPGKPEPLLISYQQLTSHVASFQQKLAKLGIAPQAAVSIALPNSYEFIVAFLAASWQRAIAAPLNSAYKQAEFEFYIDDLSSALAIVPRGSFQQNGPAVRAARKYQAAVAECYWNGRDVVLDVKDTGKLSGKGNQTIQKAQPDDVALVLHTSGTTGRPKAVCVDY